MTEKEFYENGEQIPGMPDILTIVWFKRNGNLDEFADGVRHYIIWATDEEPCLLFGDILKIAEDRGYELGTVMLIADNPLSGKIYEYNNYHDGKWHNYGTTRGYA